MEFNSSGVLIAIKIPDLPVKSVYKSWEEAVLGFVNGAIRSQRYV